ncbi:MAG TPA: Rieske (2Fe-2S) protein [Devosiaceae bacterium]
MKRHVVATRAEVDRAGRKLVEADGKPIALFRLGGEYFAILDRCPHLGGSLSAGMQVGLIEADEPGAVTMSRPGEFVRCPWHGWEFDIRSGKSYCDPERFKARDFAVHCLTGRELAEGPYVAETFKVEVEGDYIVIET